MTECTTMAMRLKAGDVVTLWGWSTDLHLVTGLPRTKANGMVEMPALNLLTSQLEDLSFYTFSIVSVLIA